MTDWPHSPPHRLDEAGTYMVTGGTYRKSPLLNTPAKLDVVRTLLFDIASEYEASLHAWAIMSNHYHFIASTQDAGTLQSGTP